MRARAGATARHTFRALTARNYRLYFIGQIVSVSGTWMQTIALTWLVLQLGGSGLMLGLTLAMQYLPLLVLGPLAGVAVDRFDKRRTLLLTQSTAATMALVIGVLTASGLVRLWMVFGAAIIIGFVNALDVPTRQTFTYEMVGADLLPNAVTLNSIIMNSGRLVGPAVAGLAIATIGLSACFLLNAVSYLTLITALLLMDTGRLHRADPAPRRPGQLREGLRYVKDTPAVRTPLLVMAVIGTFTYEFNVMLPVLARFTFGSDAAGFSLLMSAMGVGSVLGGLVAAAVVRPSARRMGMAGTGLGALVMLAALMPSLAATAVVMVGVGALSITFLTLANATLQLTAAPEMRGRVVALYAVAFLGSIPIGGPIMGFVGEQLGGRGALFAAGATAVATCAVAWRSLNRHGATELVERRTPASAARADTAGSPAPALRPAA